MIVMALNGGVEDASLIENRVQTRTRRHVPTGSSLPTSSSACLSCHTDLNVSLKPRSQSLSCPQISSSFCLYSLIHELMKLLTFYRLSSARHKSVNLTLRCSLLLILLISSSLINLSGACQFPPHWAGSWFQKGVPDAIRILNGNISEKGICRESNGEKFLIENRNDRCVRCMVISERHQNVLQYKETYQCHAIGRGRLSIDSVCSEINGDAPLYSLFRLDARSVSCPFTGAFTFSYSRGSGECLDPVSTIESCTDDHHLLLKVQACADVYASESKTEELECFAEWKEGSYRYLVGKLHHNSAKTDEDKFRCFVFDKTKDEPEGYEIAQSGDATCDGLLSPKDGSRTLKIHKTLATIARCVFPSWMIAHRHWKLLDGSHMYDFNRENSSFLVYNITHAGEVVRNGRCIQQTLLQESNVTSNNAFNISQYIVHVTTGCKSGFICMKIYQRSQHIVEIQYGNLANQVNDACSTYYFKPSTAKFHTLTTLSPETRECPFEGIYAVNVAASPDDERSSPVIHQHSPSSDETLLICSQQSSLNSRCNSNDHMQIQSRCNYNDAIRNFRCRGGWEENGTNYLIASSNEDDIRQYCLVYDKSNDELRMTISSATCHTNLATTHLPNTHVALKLTNTGVCSQVSGASIVHITNQDHMLKFIIIQLTLFYLLMKSS